LFQAIGIGITIGACGKASSGRLTYDRTAIAIPIPKPAAHGFSSIFGAATIYYARDIGLAEIMISIAALVVMSWFSSQDMQWTVTWTR